MSSNTLTKATALALLMGLVPVAQALDFDLRGSLGEKGGLGGYVPPVSNPLFNETPYITTEIRPIFLHNKIPSGFLTRGGVINVIAAEVRVAVNDRLGIIATKDGYADANFKATLPNDSAFVNISLGAKYAVWTDPATNGIVTIGAEYEPPTGNLKTANIRLQGRGGGFLDLFVSGARRWDKLGLQANVGANLAVDGDHDSSMLHYSVHADYEVLPGLYPLAEFNGFTTLGNGKRTTANFEGLDLINFGSTDSGTVMTVAGGARYVVNEHLQLGVGYETPITGRKDIMDERYYLDMVIHY